MQIAVLEALRCPAPHAPGPLIAALHRRHDGDVREATLGCPACGAEFAVRDGWAWMGDAVAPTAGERPDDDALTRAGALLGLLAGGGVVALAPAWAEYAHPLVALTDVAAVVVGPPAGFSTGDGVSAIAGTRALPCAAGTFRGVALDAWVAADDAALASWISGCAARGRVVAPADVPVPPGVRELARDTRHWVGEREAALATPPVALQRAAAARAGGAR
ncbi:MAG: hypothetical protein ACK53A_04350 [Gemmatimonadota bacterium]|jgi:hypothetical protein|nr:Trm112 family protein [Gemmatimonadota bacterium]